MLTQEQIAANIAATRARRSAATHAQRAAARERRAIDQRERYPEYNGKLIGFVVHTKRGFKPFIGRPIDSPGDRDSLVHVIGSQQPQETLDAALAFFAPDRDKLALVMQKPVPNGLMMGHWLASMLGAQQGSR